MEGSSTNMVSQEKVDRVTWKCMDLTTPTLGDKMH